MSHGFSGNVSFKNTTGIKQYSHLYVIINAFQSLNVLVIGSLGNVMVIIVVARRSVIKSPTNVYLLTLAVADLIFLNVTIIPNIIELNYPVNHWNLGSVLCPVLVFLQYYTCNTSVIFITLFSHERWVAICYPMKARLVSNVSKVRYIILCTWLVSFLYHSMWLYLATAINEKINDMCIQKCTFRLNRKEYKVIYMMDATIFYFIPLLLMSGFYIHIGNALYFQKPVSLQTFKQTRASRIQIIKMLLVVSVSFAILCLPYRTLVVYNSFSKKIYKDYWFLLFSKNMMLLNSAINPIFYNVMSENFRRAFKKLAFRCSSLLRVESNL